MSLIEASLGRLFLEGSQEGEAKERGTWEVGKIEMEMQVRTVLHCSSHHRRGPRPSWDM